MDLQQLFTPEDLIVGFAPADKWEAIEALVDRIGTQPHELSGRAKDVGSAAVLVAIALAVLVWLLVLTK